MKILVYGAGNIGSLYAALLQRSGQQVTLLARGRRLAEIREHGVRLEHPASGTKVDVRVDVVERLEPDEPYDLVLVTLPRQHVAEVLPILRASRATPSVMFFGNNAAGPGEMVEALGRERVLLGFPGAAAVRHDGRLRYVITSAREQLTTIGEVDGARSGRLEAIAEVLEAAGFPTALCSTMDAWLKTHAAEIVPTAGAVYMTGLDPERLARTRDALVLMLRAIREGYRVLAARGIPITPGKHRLFQWLPEPVLLLIMRRRAAGADAAVEIGHAADARAEMEVLIGELRTLAATTSVPTPASDRLATYLDPSARPIPDRSAEIPLRWGGVVGLGLGLATTATLVWRRRRSGL